jgi:predicted small secreted protein
MRHRFPALLLGACTVLAGCGVLDSPTGRDAVAAPAGTTPASTAPATSGMGSAKDAGNLPDPCDLLSDAEVIGLTGRAISQQDVDDAPADSSVRYCQWQQTGGQLALFLSRTTEADFETVIADATTVTGVGQDAFALAGHLYVLYGTVQLDVYSRGDSDDENLEKAKKVAEVVMPRI